MASFNSLKLCVLILASTNALQALSELRITWAGDPRNILAHVHDAETGARIRPVVMHFSPNMQFFYTVYGLNSQRRRIELYSILSHECILRADVHLRVSFGARLQDHTFITFITGLDPDNFTNIITTLNASPFQHILINGRIQGLRKTFQIA